MKTEDDSLEINGRPLPKILKQSIVNSMKFKKNDTKIAYRGMNTGKTDIDDDSIDNLSVDESPNLSPSVI